MHLLLTRRHYLTEDEEKCFEKLYEPRSVKDHSNWEGRLGYRNKGMLGREFISVGLSTGNLPSGDK
jgi:hypothetical protein